MTDNEDVRKYTVLLEELDEAQREKARKRWQEASDGEKRALMFDAYVLGLFDPEVFG